MTAVDNEVGLKNNIEQNGNKKWDITCKISNIVFSIIYGLFSWIFAFLGIMFFSLGLPDKAFSAICSFVSSLLFLLTPLFCVLAIVFSVLLKKRKNYLASLLIQFVPFGVLGVALVSFLLSVVYSNPAL